MSAGASAKKREDKKKTHTQKRRGQTFARQQQRAGSTLNHLRRAVKQNKEKGRWQKAVVGNICTLPKKAHKKKQP